MTDRGVIRNPQYCQTISDFRGLRWGNITPTDLDGLIEYHNKLFVLLEAKYGDAELPYGQKLALERLSDSINKPTLLIVFNHQTTPPNRIDFANAIVSSYRNKGCWYKEKQGRSVKTLIDKFIELNTK